MNTQEQSPTDGIDKLEADGFKFTVMEVKDQRILRVVVKKNDTSEENESDEKSENKKSE